MNLATAVEPTLFLSDEGCVFRMIAAILGIHMYGQIILGIARLPPLGFFGLFDILVYYLYIFDIPLPVSSLSAEQYLCILLCFLVI